MKISILEDGLKFQFLTGEQIEDIERLVKLFEFKVDSKPYGVMTIWGEQKYLYSALYILAKKYDIDLW